tara:strand:- start:215 stop:517 length:303 start_codon:yes stop_codon:yes gene_type:complete
MINTESKKNKLDALIKKIKDVDSKYGSELCELLLIRLGIKTNQFFQDFEHRSKESFKFYWKKNLEIKNRHNDLGLKKEKNNRSNNKIPKFIEEFENKNKN